MNSHPSEPLEAVACIFLAVDRAGLCGSVSTDGRNTRKALNEKDALNGALEWALSVPGIADEIHKADIIVTNGWVRIIFWNATYAIGINSHRL
jgi:hypothetical protein